MAYAFTYSIQLNPIHFNGLHNILNVFVMYRDNLYLRKQNVKIHYWNFNILHCLFGFYDLRT